ncbi:hypothetical protein [Thalassovita aquimarina]|uniref:Uncharacterized protein n=1 Tax=Thalassovita aquimarina TaxID=2785917 RepID=A0ABS5HRL5_9RHOB|nr:hypothetical protein [Thalassovita aquimarina]MBR9651624.1 hypothetical protein [Thalassovita aquimarina]
MGDDIVFWIIQGPGWLLFAYLVVAQCTSALSYELGVRWGTQEPREQITDVGVAFWWGLALADLVFYTPLLAVGLIAHWVGADWVGPVLGAALGATVYWPVASLATVWKARGAAGWKLPKERQYWVVLPLIAGWGAVALVLLVVSA